MKLRSIAGLSVAAALLLSVAPAAEAISLVGLTNSNSLVLFDSATPSSSSTVSVTGVTGTLLGIDFRPANGLVYGLTDTNNLYTINPFTGAATFVSTLSVPFTGGQISGVDFNPVPDRLRVVGANDQNFRINVDTGAVIVDGTINPGDPNLTGAAYTNVDTDLNTGTTLYTIDYVTDQLFIQNPPNDGTLVAVGSLGIDFGPEVGFDIATVNGANFAFATSGSNLYSIDLGTGAASFIGATGASFVGLTSIPQPVPEPSPLAGLVPFAGLLAFARLRKRQTGV